MSLLNFCFFLLLPPKKFNGPPSEMSRRRQSDFPNQEREGEEREKREKLFFFQEWQKFLWLFPPPFLLCSLLWKQRLECSSSRKKAMHWKKRKVGGSLGTSIVRKKDAYATTKSHLIIAPSLAFTCQKNKIFCEKIHWEGWNKKSNCSFFFPFFLSIVAS